MSYPEGHSNGNADESSLNLSAGSEEGANFLPDTSRYFENWLETLKPPATPSESLPPASESSAAPFVPEKPREVRFEGTLRIDGYIAGAVHSEQGTLITTEAAEIDGDVSVDTAIIFGRVRGDIKAASRVELGGTARVIGDVEAPVLWSQPGAVFEGRCTFLLFPGPPGESDSQPSSSKKDQEQEAEVASAAAGARA